MAIVLGVVWSDIAIIRSCSRVIELGVVLVTVMAIVFVVVLVTVMTIVLVVVLVTVMAIVFCGGVVRHSNHQKL